MATQRLIEAADTDNAWKVAQRKRRSEHREDSMFTQVMIPESLQACMLNTEDALDMRERIEELLPEGEDRDLMLAMILGRGDGLEEGWSGYEIDSRLKS